MTRILSVLCATALTLTSFGAMSAPIISGPALVEVQSAPNRVEQVQFNQKRKNRAHNQNRQHRRNKFERRGNRAYYNGHRGYNKPRRGYRQHNGYWFPGAAFITGAIIGGIITNQPSQGGNRHVRWCFDHYRSYRVSDNTFQPYHGPRKQCRSPY